MTTTRIPSQEGERGTPEAGSPETRNGHQVPVHRQTR